jgi:hypothetical protein
MLLIYLKFQIKINIIQFGIFGHVLNIIKLHKKDKNVNIKGQKKEATAYIQFGIFGHDGLADIKDARQPRGLSSGTPIPLRINHRHGSNCVHLILYILINSDRKFKKNIKLSPVALDLD